MISNFDMKAWKRTTDSSKWTELIGNGHFIIYKARVVGDGIIKAFVYKFMFTRSKPVVV